MQFAKGSRGVVVPPPPGRMRKAREGDIEDDKPDAEENREEQKKKSLVEVKQENEDTGEVDDAPGVKPVIESEERQPVAETGSMSSGHGQQKPSRSPEQEQKKKKKPKRKSNEPGEKPPEKKNKMSQENQSHHGEESEGRKKPKRFSSVQKKELEKIVMKCLKKHTKALNKDKLSSDEKS